MRRTTFARRVRRLNEPFYLICGFGYTGKRLVSRLDEQGIQTVVIDANPLAIDELEAHSLGLAVPGLCGDSADPDTLNIAGIRRKNCVGVIAITNDDHTNLAISIDSKLVDPDRLVISRSQSATNTANLASFGTDYIIDPFETFALHLVKSIREPYKHIISDLVFNPYHKVWASPHQDTSGRWIVCGYGRFGQAIDRLFRRHEIPITFIEADPKLRGAPTGTVLGMGTEEDTLREAKIETATGIVAGTPDDADNLSIILTAKQIKPDIITVARQNLSSNKPMFRAASVNLIMEPVRIIADEIFIRITTPLLMDFLEGLQAKDEQWARELVVKIGKVVEEQPMEAWAYNMNEQKCPAIIDSLNRGKLVTLGHLCRDPRNRDNELPAFPLLLKRGSKRILLPATDTPIEAGDDILISGKHQALASMNWIVHNYNVLRYIRTGVEAPGGLLWQWLSTRRRRRSAS
jgi:Trk K+ transport system NAD-binding subunit